MTIYKSNLVRKKTRNRGLYAGKDETRSGRIFLPIGTALTTADSLLFVPVGENQVIKKITLLAAGDGRAIKGSIGRFQMVDSAGNPVEVQRLGPFGEAAYTFTSPETSEALYKSAGDIGGYTETIIAAPEKLSGPVNVGIQITEDGTLAADTEMYLGVTLAGETSPNEVSADYIQSYWGNEYLIGQ